MEKFLDVCRNRKGCLINSLSTKATNRASGLLCVMSLVVALGWLLTPSALLAGDRIYNERLVIKPRSFPLSKRCKPCDNFYQYVCSETIKRFKLPADRSRYVFSFNDASERILKAKQRYLQALASGKICFSDDRFINQLQHEIRNYFLAAYNSKARRQQELEEIRRVIEELYRLNSREEIKNWLADNITKAENVSWITISSVPNRNNPKKLDLAIYLDILNLPDPSYYQDPAVMNDFIVLLEKFFTCMGCTQPKAKAKFVADFEREFAKHSMTSAQQREFLLSDNRVSRNIWREHYSNFKLERLWCKIPKLVTVREFSGEDAWGWLNKRLDKMTVDQLHTLLLYQQLFDVIEESYPEFYQAELNFLRKHLGAAPKQPSKLEKATLSLMTGLGRELDYVLIPYLFPDFSKQRVAMLVERIRQSLVDQLKTNGWLSSGGRRAAINKIEHLRLSLVYPDKLVDWNLAPVLDYDPYRPLTNYRRLAQVRLDQMLRELSQPVNLDRWDMSPLTVNAYYDPSKNIIVIPLGILQPPFYDQSLSDVINLGGIGVVIGHEMGHAIDDIGNHYDANGKYNAWMSDADKHCFKTRSAKLVTQFDQIGHSGKFTLGENIGDLVGLTTAYRAADWHNIKTICDKPASVGKVNCKSKASVDDLKRQFFIQFAKLWCACERPGLTQRRLRTDPHALEWARVNQGVKQQPGFAQAFGCQDNDAMVLPETELVKIW